MVGISEYAEGILRVPGVVDRLHDDINHLTTLEYTTIHREIEAHPKQAVDKANLDEEALEAQMAEVCVILLVLWRLSP